jgi:hypothetical protein
MERTYTQQEIQAFTDAERELAALGLIVSDKFNTDVIVGWFDQHPEVPATKETIIRFVQNPMVKPKLRWKSEAQMKFEQAAHRLSPEELDVLERFLKSNRLYHGDDDRTFLNAYQFIAFHGSRPWNPSILANWTLNYIQGNSREPLHWVTPGADPNKKYGQHSGGDSHFMRKSDVNQLPALSGRIDHAKSTAEIPRPESSSKMNEYQWTQMATSLRADSGRHSDTASIQSAVKAVLDQGGTPEEAYKEGVRVKKQIRMAQERGR